MSRTIAFCALAAAVAAVPANARAAAPETYGSLSLSGIYSSQSGDFDTEEINGSALVPQVTLGARWSQNGNLTRVEATSAYWSYFDRENRFYNALAIEQRLGLGGNNQLGVTISGAVNLATLEAESADQLAAIGRFIIRPDKSNTLVLGGGVRRRWYDDSNARSWSPIVYADYRRTFARNQYLDLGASHERTNATAAVFDYRRTYLGAFYTHPLGDRTRVRAGLSYRWWQWDARLTPGGRERRDRLLLPQLRLTHNLTRTLELEGDYRRIVRRSNDDRLDRNGNFAAATLRYRF